jgi:putative endonuclease
VPEVVDMHTGGRNIALGAYGERVAARYLIEQGMTLLDRNWRCPAGEVDLVLRDGQVLVFCEVKTRSDTAYGHPLEAVGDVKTERLLLLAELWMEEHLVRPDDVRLDIVGVLLSRAGAAEVEHVRGIG